MNGSNSLCSEKNCHFWTIVTITYAVSALEFKFVILNLLKSRDFSAELRDFYKIGITSRMIQY